MRFQMPYYHATLPLEVPDENLAHVLRGGGIPHNEKSEAELVKDALLQPIGATRLSELAIGKKTALVITSDHTRSVPSKITLPLLLAEIRRQNPEIRIQILIATGLHRPTTSEEMYAMFGAELVESEHFVVHKAFQKEDMQYICKLPSGAELSVNKLVTETELLVTEGFIEPHFFAGFSGGRKSILPGVCSAETINENHSARAIGNAHATTGVLKGNPIHEDMIYAAQKVHVDFILNVALDSEKRIAAAFAGDVALAHEAGCRFVSQACGEKRVTSDIVITTNGGYPLDQNLYQSPKCVSTAAACAGEDGVIIVGASLCDGIGGNNFGTLMQLGTPDEILAYVQAIPPKETQPEQWCAQIYAGILKKHKIILVTQHFDHAQLEQLGFLTASSFEEALKKAFRLKGERATVTVIPDGVAVIVQDEKELSNEGKIGGTGARN